MTAREFALPDLGEGLTEAEIVRWLVDVGDEVAVDQPVVEVETAKAVMEVPTPYAGVVTGRPAAEGAVLDVGAVLVVIDDSPVPAAAPLQDAAAARYAEEERAGSTSGNVLVGYGTSDTARRRRARRRPMPKAAPPAPGPGRTRVASPLVRRLARDGAVDLTAVEGTGPDGLILRSDVLKAIAATTAPTVAPAPAAAPAGDLPRPVRERIPLRGARRAAAEVFARSRREVPEATVWVDVDATGLVEFRRQANAGRAVPLGLLALISRFVLAGLARHPELNSRVDEAAGEIVLLDGVNLGFAAQTDRGLVVPVLKDAHVLSAARLHDGLTGLADAARAGRLAPADMTGGTFTLNNYGMFGVDGSAAIINHPEAAILGIGRIIDRPWAVDGALAVRKVAQLSLVFDHRVCDGGTAAAFLRFVADCLERPHAALADL
ncbi:dihydrolipoamide acetyltransferase family protein [Actinomadura parmotrematis]|uniref:Dihydrolipoamide acetyltransferase component of pyruvate dehydrogenase complex n=1 Tax=Actinomadura parmotrematis TaxID=2864039 RepID=A0ABS7FQC0_9ACTN|nr:dihydrolipoamide acetyltransferase family protein [Actinomadura parmotrematis]MBW8482598.1 2-oxo acid dehydrogenase subunit E2 [Actinomadura parmotrematis]